MKVEIRYFSKTGNTKKLADAIGEAVGKEALTVETPLTEDVDVLFLGSSVMAAQPRKEVKKFISSIDVNVGQVINFGTASFSESTYTGVKKLVEKNGMKMSDKEFHCKGSFKGLYKERPNQEDLDDVKAFAKNVIA